MYTTFTLESEAKGCQEAFMTGAERKAMQTWISKQTVVHIQWSVKHTEDYFSPFFILVWIAVKQHSHFVFRLRILPLVVTVT